MPRAPLAELGRHRALVAVTVIQAACALVFLADMLAELPEFRTEPLHPLIEGATVLALWLGSAMGFREIRRLLRQKAHLDSRMRAASGMARLTRRRDSASSVGRSPLKRSLMDDG